MASPVVIILAAGRGERFLASGGMSHKLDALLGNKSIVAHVIQAVTDAGLTWHLVRPAGGTAGMGTSIALGVSATEQASGWLILPADLPFVQPTSLQQVAAKLQDNAIVVPHYHQQHGHPVGFRRDCLPELLSLNGDSGAKALVQHARQHNRVYDLMLNDEGILYDIDTLSDLHAAQRRKKRTNNP
ncbi:MAG: nucleotidyltransferase family protein [Silvania sp.]|uniref:nucleotidyltransferase family protein n=1 Tax=Silvania sp. TaxID=3016633 RepID=UPI003EE49981